MLRDFDFMPAAGGKGRIAYVDYDDDWYLYEITVPEFSAQKVARLISENTLDLLKTQYPEQNPDYPEPYPDNLWLAFTDPGSLQWSHAGDILAFSGAMDGFSTDLYFYYPSSGNIERVSSGPTQVVDVSWSPDDRFVVYWGAAHLIFKMTAHYLNSGGWVYDRQKQTNRSILRGPDFIRWVSDTRLLSHYHIDFCGNGSLIITDAENLSFRAANPLDSVFGDADMDPKTGSLLLSALPSQTTEDMCGSWNVRSEAGLFLFTDGVQQTMEPVEYSDDSLSNIEIQWSPEANVFVLSTFDKAVLMDTKGRILATIAVEGMMNIHWSSDGRTMYFFKRDKTTDLYMATAPIYQPVKITDGIYFDEWTFEWIY